MAFGARGCREVSSPADADDATVRGARLTGCAVRCRWIRLDSWCDDGGAGGGWRFGGGDEVDVYRALGRAV